ncbi:MAG: ABC transporter permease, partial [Acidobacteriota bacterium]|nr:ABC transporter permease [Acidobacteriota bacterium]
MRWPRKAILFLKNLFLRQQTETNLRDELGYHLDQEIETNVRAGMNPRDARHAALRSIGSMMLYEEECRDSRSTAFIESMGRDVRYAVRFLRRSPLFTAVAIVTLALGIGANTMVFTLVNTVLFRPLPVKDPQRLVFFNEGESGVNMSYPNYRDFRDRNDVLSGLAAYRFTPLNLSIHGDKNRRVWGYEATGNYFDLLGVQPRLGRFFHPADDDQPNAHPVAVFSYGFWQQHFHSDPTIVNKSVKLNGLTYTVLGVAPKEFNGTELIVKPDVWVPMSMEARIESGNEWLNKRSMTQIWVLGRLKPAISPEQAEASLNRIETQLEHDFPLINQHRQIHLSPPGLIGKALRGPVVGFSGVLMSVAGLLLLLACVNMAGMLLARASDRRKEIAVRLSIGAGKAQLLRQLLIESLLLALSGSAAGFALCVSICRALSALNLPFDIPVNTSLVPDARVLLFTLAAAFFTTLLFGLTPALQALKIDLIPALKNEAALQRFRRLNLRDVLVAAQITLSVVLVIASGLVVRSLQHALSLNLGFNPDQAVSVSFNLGLQGYTPQHGEAFNQRLLEQIETIPGIEAVATVSNMPLRVGTNGSLASIVGKPNSGRAPREFAVFYDISSGYLRAAGTRLLTGRNIDGHDN